MPIFFSIVGFLSSFLMGLVSFASPSESPDWKPCAIVTGQAGEDALCAHVALPLDGSKPNGRKISIFVKKVVGPDRTRPHKQLWLIEGGPGTASAINEPSIASWLDHDPATDVYIRDHRGVGDSFGLFCPKTEKGIYGFHNPLPLELWNECINEILSAPAGSDKHLSRDELLQFNATNAAKDLAALISATREPGQTVQIVGSSYGTMLVQRYLQIEPDQADAVILDGTGAFGVSSLLRWDEEHERVGMELLDLCEKDALCRSKFAGAFGTAVGPHEALALVMSRARTAGSTCGGIRYDRIRAALAILVDVTGVRDLLPALIYRLARCSSEDVVAIEYMKKNFFGALTGGRSEAFTSRSSEVLQNLIGASEMALVAEGKSASAVVSEERARQETLSFTAGLSLQFARIFEIGISYPRDAYFGQFAARKKPLLILNGALDPSTPLKGAATVASNYTGPKQWFIPVPTLGHVTLGNHCAMTIGRAFLDRQSEVPDSSCLSQMPAISFKGDRVLSCALFNQQDAWESGEGPCRPLQIRKKAGAVAPRP